MFHLERLDSVLCQYKWQRSTIAFTLWEITSAVKERSTYDWHMRVSQTTCLKSHMWHVCSGELVTGRSLRLPSLKFKGDWVWSGKSRREAGETVPTDESLSEPWSVHCPRNLSPTSRYGKERPILHPKKRRATGARLTADRVVDNAIVCRKYFPMFSIWCLNLVLLILIALY